MANKKYTKYSRITHEEFDKVVAGIKKLENISDKLVSYVTTAQSKAKVNMRFAFKTMPLSVSRTAGENYLIYLNAVERKRDPVVFSDLQQYAIAKLATEEVEKAFGSGPDVIKRLYEEVGKRLVKFIKSNIQRGICATGRMWPLKEKYYKFKMLRFGKKPILVRTGAFRKSIKTGVGEE